MVENNKNCFKIENVQGDLGTTDLTNLSWQKLGHWSPVELGPKNAKSGTFYTFYEFFCTAGANLTCASFAGQNTQQICDK